MVAARKRMAQLNLKSTVLFPLLVLALTSIGTTQTAFVKQPEHSSSRNVASYPGADFGTRLAACISDLPAVGGVCDARSEGADPVLSSDLIIAKPFTTIYLPQSIIQLGSHSILVRAATHGVSLLATAMHGRSTIPGQTRLRYSGTGCAIQVGDPSDNTVGFRADDLFIDLTPAASEASGLCLTRTQDFSILRPTIMGIQSEANKQVLIRLDGTGNYSGGLIQQPFLSNGNIHIFFTGKAGTTQGANAVTVLSARSDGNGGSSIAVKIENGDGNTFLGGDFENMGTAFYLGSRAINNSFYGLRLEKNKEDFMMTSGSQRNTVYTPEVRIHTDNGTQNTILSTRSKIDAALTFRTEENVACMDSTLRLNGTTPGDAVVLGTPPPPPSGFFSAFVSTANTVTVRYCSLVANSSTSGDFHIEVSKR